MGGIIKSVVEKSGAKGTFWIAVIEGEGEVMAFDKAIVALEGKENPYEIGISGTGKKFLKVPKAGGFQGKSGGGWKGKSDKEIYAGILTMLFAYSKDEVVPMITSDNTVNWVEETTLRYYRTYSKAVLADLKVLCPDVPVEAVKGDVKPPVATPQATSPPKAPATPKDTENMTVKEKLTKKLWDHLRNVHADSDENFRALLMEITAFVGKDGKEVCAESIDKMSDKWAGSAIGKLEKFIEEEERKDVANADLGDIAF